MKPMLKALGTNCFELAYDSLLSSVAFSFKLRRYNKAARKSTGGVPMRQENMWQY